MGLPADQRHAGRGPALPASPNAVARVLREAGYEMDEQPTRRHPDRAVLRAGQAQSALADRSVHVHAQAAEPAGPSGRVHGRPQPVHHRLRAACQPVDGPGDRGAAGRAWPSTARPQRSSPTTARQYVTWRGKSQFTRNWRSVASGRSWPGLGIRRRWARSSGSGVRCGGSVCETAVFLDLDDARQRIGLFIDYYNFQRPHQGIDGLVPADRFFDAAPEVRKTLKERVAANALELARHGCPRSRSI